MTVTEFVLMLTTIGPTWRWWVERRDAHSSLSLAKTEADKTVKTLTDTIATKNTEIDRIQDDREYWRERAMHAESLAYERGSR